MKIKKMLMALLLTVTVLMCGCGKNKSTDETSTVSAIDLEEAMVDADHTLPEMLAVDSNTADADELFASISDCDYSMVDSYFLSYSNAGTADEIAVIKVKNSDDVETMLDSINTHVTKRIKLYQTYEPDEVSKAENAKIFTEGNFVVLIVCNYPNDVKAAFENGIK